MEIIGKNAILMHFQAIVPDIRSSEEPEKILTANYSINDFPAVWNYSKLSAKFLVSSVKVIDTVGFLLVSFTQIAIF